jgi:DNA-binding NtrC family response regulator
LRDRREDIPDLAQSYVEHFRNRIGVEVKGIENAALHALVDYPWPGNVRELINVIERAVLLSTGERMSLEDFPEEIASSRSSSNAGYVTGHLQADSDWLERPWAEARMQVLERAERLYLERQLTRAQGRVGEAAALAGIDPRSLYEKMQRYGLRKEAFRKHKADAN